MRDNIEWMDLGTRIITNLAREDWEPAIEIIERTP